MYIRYKTDKYIYISVFVSEFSGVALKIITLRLSLSNRFDFMKK